MQGRKVMVAGAAPSLDRAGRRAVDPSAAELALVAHLDRLRSGDLSALEEIYQSVGADLYGLALVRTGSASDAADVLQEVFVRLAGRAQTLAPVRRPRAYLLTMTHRVAVDLFRRRRRTEPIDEELVDVGEISVDRRLDASIAARHLRHLPAKQREAVYLRFVAELSFAEVGRVTGVPTFTAASRCRLGILRLRRAIGDET